MTSDDTWAGSWEGGGGWREVVFEDDVGEEVEEACRAWRVCLERWCACSFGRKSAVFECAVLTNRHDPLAQLPGWPSELGSPTWCWRGRDSRGRRRDKRCMRRALGSGDEEK